MHKIVISVAFLFLFTAEENINGQTTNNGDTLRVLTFNMWLGGEAGKQPLDKSLEVIRTSRAKIVGLQEACTYRREGSVQNDNGRKMAEVLGWNYFSQGSSGILTAYNIVDTTENGLGVKLQFKDDRFIWFFNCHLFHIPYQPYQLAGKRYGDFPFIGTEEEAVAFAESARGDEVKKYAGEIRQILHEGWPVILTGDFNEPSFFDWTQKAVDANLCPLKVEWPSTRFFYNLGLKDAFREFYPDEVEHRGESWSSIDTTGEIHDRIDFVLYKEKLLKVTCAKTIGFKDGKSDVGIDGYPSDHRAVCVSFLMHQQPCLENGH
jgi:exonuclease III